LDEIVVSCDHNITSRAFQELRKKTASDSEKNLALAFLRAFHKKERIRQLSENINYSTTICAEVIDGGDVSDRSVTISIRVTLN
jgi:hypothetical protein